jgi:O-antigen ligase
LAKQGPFLIKIVVAGAVVSALLCLYQITHGYSGIWGSAEQQSLEADQSYDTLWPLIRRASAAFNGPNAAGGFLAMGAIAGLAHGYAFRKFRAKYRAASFICWAGVLSTFSRGALLGSITGSIFALWVLGWCTRARAAVLVCVLALAAGVVAINRDVQSVFRLGTDFASASPTRVDAWQAASVLIRRNPVFGIGFYEFHDLSQGIIGSSDTPVHPHNGFLKALVEEGPAGGIAYLLFIVAFLWNSKRSVRSATAPQDRWVLASIAGIGASLFTQEFFDAGFALGSSSLAILFASLLAIQTSLGPRLKEPQQAIALSAPAFS